MDSNVIGFKKPSFLNSNSNNNTAMVNTTTILQSPDSIDDVTDDDNDVDVVYDIFKQPELIFTELTLKYDKENRRFKLQKACLDFIKKLDTYVVNGKCLDKNEVLSVMETKFLFDLDVPQHARLTNDKLLEIWTMCGGTEWAKRKNVKSGYNRKKDIVEFE